MKILTLWLLQEHGSSMYSGHSYHMLPIKHYMEFSQYVSVIIKTKHSLHYQCKHAVKTV